MLPPFRVYCIVNHAVYDKSLFYYLTQTSFHTQIITIRLSDLGV